VTTAFDFSRASLRPRAALCVFTIAHNGVVIPGEEYASASAAALRAWKIAEETGSDINCFRVDRVWL
jgi:hypothetical protein